MRYQVPQFIEIEDKIFGPLTIKQFIYLAGGAALSYLVYIFANAYIPFFLIVVLIIPILAFAAALAFYKINGKPFISVVESAIKYYIGNKLYIWKKEAKKITIKEEKTTPGAIIVPRLADSKLKDLAWNLNISKEENKHY
jgi:PrgI family protein